jgi:DNA-binding NtrC family response regulator
MKNVSEQIPDTPALDGLVDLAILDDDPDFCTYLDDALRDDGLYSIRSFVRPEDLFTACEQRLPEIVLLDMKMGEFKGEKVLEQLQVAHPGLCVIIITGYPSLEDMRATFKMKVFDYISKPFSLAQLRQTLHNAIEKFGFGRAAPDRLRERLGHHVKMLRVARDWSLKDLAAATKLSISQISSIERGANLPSIESLLAICRAFDKRPSEVLAAIEF